MADENAGKNTLALKDFRIAKWKLLTCTGSNPNDDKVFKECFICTIQLVNGKFDLLDVIWSKTINNQYLCAVNHHGIAWLLNMPNHGYYVP